MIVYILLWTAVAMVACMVLCWLCEQRFQATNIPEEELYWSKLRNLWFICTLGSGITVLYLIFVLVAAG